MSICGHRIAGILTRRTPGRRISGGERTRRAAQAVCTALLLAMAAGGALASTGGESETLARQPVDDIRAAAEQYLEQRLAGTGRELAPRAAQLDPRLQLPRCERALEAFQREDGRIDSRTVIGVRCSGQRPWKVYVPVEIVEMRTVQVAGRSLPRGHLLVAGDLVTEERDVSRLVGGYIADAGDILGHRLKQPVPSGAAIALSMFDEQILIERGQTVTLVVENDALQIRMAGVALMDGSLNQRIRVENTASARVVEGIVRSPQQVEVLVR